jgi:glycosyltransferase involved in cell wall biosynthesis
VIPAFNAERTITSAVRSALLQTVADLEVIVVDDGSTDRTTEVVARLDDTRVRLISARHAGPAAARNAGIAASHGKYVTFLDSDDLLMPEYLELMLAALETASNPGFAYTDAYAFDESTGRVRHSSVMDGQRPPVPPPSDPRDFLAELLVRNFVYNAATVPRTVLEDVGGYDTSTPRSEDYALWLKILVKGYVPVWVPGRHALYRLHLRQRSTNRERMSSGRVFIYNSLRMEDMPTPGLRDLLARRRDQASQELQIVRGDRRVAWTLRQGRHWVGRLRQRLGLGHRWYAETPPDVAVAFPDLTGV